MKKITALFVSIVFLLTVLPMNIAVVFADVPNWQDEGVPVEVPLKANNVFEIRTAAELAWVAQKVNAAVNSSTFEEYTVKLMNDIDLSEREWTPIGLSSAKSFHGNFDGNNKVIEGLRIGTELSPDSQYEYVGLFGYAQYGTIKNVGMEQVKLYASLSYSGALVGRGNYSKINNCYATGYVSGDSAGGLVGRGSSIKSSYSACDVNGSRYAGGLSGYHEQNLIIFNSYATGDVVGDVAGGLVGFNADMSNFAISIVNCYAAGKADGIRNGGLVGETTRSNLNYAYESYYNGDGNATGTGTLSDSETDNFVSKTAEELKSKEFVDLLNKNGTLAGVVWLRDAENKNQGFPVLSNVTLNPNKYWIGNAVPVAEKSGGVYEISSAGQLAWISLQVLNGNAFVGKTVKLMNNIDLSGKEWSPIGGWRINSMESYGGSGSGGYPEFSGTFDGNFKKIKELTIGAPQRPCLEYGSAGLFGNADFRTNRRTVIKNVGLENVKIYVVDYAGALIGQANYFNEISNCYSSGVVRSDLGTAGGLIGKSQNGIIKDCYSTVDVSGYSSGGLIGDASQPNITHCYATGNLIEQSSGTIGGFIGSATDTASLVSVYWNKNATHHRNGFDLPDNEKKGIGSVFDTDTTSGKTLDELRQRSTFSGWDFNKKWTADPSINDGLPYLSGFVMSKTPMEYAINSITLRNSSEETITSIPQNGDFVVHANIMMNKAHSGDIIMLVLYDDCGKPLKTYQDSTFITNNLGSGESATFSQPVAQVPGSTIAKIKVFIWNGLQTMEPLSHVGNCP